jgi:polysaccharide export outer membrane protein
MMSIRLLRAALVSSLCLCAGPLPLAAQQPPDPAVSPGDAAPRTGSMAQPARARTATTWVEPALHPTTYRVGPDDVLSIAVLQAPELNTVARVSDTGEISLPLIGTVTAIDLTPRELELLIEQRLREKYIREPDVTIQVTEVRSHAVSVVGAVKKPGALQIHGETSLLEVLSLAGGLSEDAGDTVLIVRQGNAAPTAPSAPPAEAASPIPVTAQDPQDAVGPMPAGGTALTQRIALKALIDAHDPAANVAVYPGDIVNVQDAAVVYVVGAVKKPGAFAMRGNDRLTVLRALALGEGLEPTAAKGDAVVLRTDEHGGRVEIPVDLGRVLDGRTADVQLEGQDVLFVPTSGAKVASKATLDFIARMVTLRGVLP